VIEGERHRVGNFTFEGNTVVKADALRTLFVMKEGDWYSQKAIRKGFQKTQEVYGSMGYYEFTGYPEPVARDTAGGAASGNGNGDGNGGGSVAQKPAPRCF
jgi:outer membrane protein assembly factor BamA